MPVEKTPAQSELGEWLESQMEAEDLPANQKEAGLKINPETAEVDWVEFDVSHSYPKVLREYYARAPESDIWVWFINLPKATETALWEKLKRKLVD